MPNKIFIPLLLLAFAVGQVGALLLERQLDIYFPLPAQSTRR